MTLVVAGTGHRPEDCTHSETEIRTMVRNKLRKSGATGFICGMASGFDLWAGDEARILGLEIWAARPWAGHVPRVDDKLLYERVLSSASRVIDIDASDIYPGPGCYDKRNRWMVDNADVVMAYWTGKEKGGTFNCVKYARGKKPISNIIGDPPF